MSWQKGTEGSPALPCGSTRLSFGLGFGDGVYAEPHNRKAVLLSHLSMPSIRWASGLSPSSLCATPQQSFNLSLAAYHFDNQTFLPGPGSSLEALPLSRDVHSPANVGSSDGQQQSKYKIRKPELPMCLVIMCLSYQSC